MFQQATILCGLTKLTEGEIDNQVASSSSNRLKASFTLHRETGMLMDLKRYTGEERYWKYSLPGLGTLSSPSVVDGVVYIGSD